MSLEDTWKLKFSRVPHLDDLQLLHISDVTHEYPPHVHEEYCIAMIRRGSETHFCRGESYEAVAGDILLIQPDEAHSSRSIDVEYKSIQFKVPLFESLSGIKVPALIDPIVREPQLFRSLSELYSILENGDSELEQASQFVATIGSLFEYVNPGDAPANVVEPRAVKKVRDYLRSHYRENVSLSSLALIANLSPFHLVRVFKNQVGVPPHEFQTQVRITHAQRLMRAGHSISNAAVETGFFDQSHFSRNFKRITGLTPRTYLRHSNIVQDS